MPNDAGDDVIVLQRGDNLALLQVTDLHGRRANTGNRQKWFLRVKGQGVGDVPLRQHAFFFSRREFVKHDGTVRAAGGQREAVGTEREGGVFHTVTNLQQQVLAPQIPHTQKHVRVPDITDGKVSSIAAEFQAHGPDPEALQNEQFPVIVR